MRKVQSNLQQRSLAFQQVCIFSFKWTEPWILAGNWYPAKYPFSFTVWCGHPTKLQTMRHIGSRCDFFLLQNFWEIPYHTSAYVSFSSESNAKECSNYRTNALISHTSKVNLKVLQARLQQYINHELPDIQAWFRKGRGTRDQIANIHWIIKNQENFRKTSTSALLTMPKPLTVWITTNCGKFLKRWEYQTTWPASWEICMQVRKQQLELDVVQQTGSK